MEKVIEKININQEVSQFIGMQSIHFSVKEINHARFNLKGMLRPMNRKKAREDFIRLAEKSDMFENPE